MYSIQDGWTALHLAAQNGHTNIIDKLVNADCDLNTVDKVILFIIICIND